MACSALLKWVAYLKRSEQTGCCDEMVSGLHTAAVEVAGFVAVGFVRPALFSLRGQIDMAVGWLYYKDHPVEWQYVVETGEGFLSKGEVFLYLNKYKENFSSRLGLLNKHKIRNTDDPYRLLSAHIHHQSSLVIPKFLKLESMVYPEKRCAEAIKLQAEVTEFISDIYVAYFGSKWASLPDSIISSVKARVPANNHPTLFA